VTRPRSFSLPTYNGGYPGCQHVHPHARVGFPRLTARHQARRKKNEKDFGDGIWRARPRATTNGGRSRWGICIDISTEAEFSWPALATPNRLLLPNQAARWGTVEKISLQQRCSMRPPRPGPLPSLVFDVALPYSVSSGGSFQHVPGYMKNERKGLLRPSRTLSFVLAFPPNST